MLYYRLQIATPVLCISKAHDRCRTCLRFPVGLVREASSAQSLLVWLQLGTWASSAWDSATVQRGAHGEAPSWELATRMSPPPPHTLTSTQITRRDGGLSTGRKQEMAGSRHLSSDETFYSL